jgi:ABC-type antimicrobial peptide transport system permease subunit
VSTLDLPAYVGAVALVMLLGLVASYLPALRASRADPMEVLRTE